MLSSGIEPVTAPLLELMALNSFRHGLGRFRLGWFSTLRGALGNSEYTPELNFTELKDLNPIRVFRTMGDDGLPLTEAKTATKMDRSMARKIYETMVKTQTTDTLFYEAQRQGRISFYLTSYGEEAVSIATAAALEPEDEAFLQYREQGFLIWRGFSIRDMADQCFSNVLEQGKGRQMPIHYGSASLHVHTISSVLATQIPHAVGAAFALKMEGKKNVAVTFFGDGAASEGDFHASLNFASTLGVPVLFICRNNGYAISTPSTEQFKSYCVAVRGPSYGIPTIRVDGGDPRAMYLVIEAARERALVEHQPILIEAMCYRYGHHSTSDDSSRYRSKDETEAWKSKDPISRFQNFLYHQKWWTAEEDTKLKDSIRQEIIEALDAASKIEKPPVSDLFTDVYHTMPWHLKEQHEDLQDFLKKHPN